MELKKHNQVVSQSKGVAVLWHSQTVKQSENYQSAECSYGVQITVADGAQSIHDGFKLAERMVERELNPKVKQQRYQLAGKEAK